MADVAGEHRFTEEEFALILRRATEMDHGPSEGSPRPISLPQRPEGLTLAEILEIAQEVGINPAQVLQAADALAVEGLSDLARIFGGPLRIRARRTLLKELSTAEMGRLLDVVRENLRTPGESHEVLGGLEWKGTKSSDPTTVRVVPESGRTVIHLTVERGLSAFLGHWGPMLLGAGAAGILIGALEPLSGGAMTGIVFGGLAVGYAVGRTIWTAGSRQWRRLLDKVANEMVEVGTAV
jgi:hypothetical protein